MQSTAQPVPGGSDGSYHLFRQPFAQFLKGEVDAAYNFRFNEASSIVYRFFAGVGWPYGNSEVMPFEEQYFGGGSNDIRAWMVRTLGPGSYVLPESAFMNQTADMKLRPISNTGSSSSGYLRGRPSSMPGTSGP
jgi:hypothetical protein